MIIDSRYKVLEQLGVGVWATVYKVVDSRTGNLCTLKLFQHLDAQTLYEKFSAEEMHHITRLEHPNLVPVITFGNMGKHIYCVSEYYNGKSLQNFKFKLNRIDLFYDLIVQVCYALHALHLQKIYHKDIKPSNILYSINDNKIEAKLVDYGFNKIDTDKNQQSISGTLPYLAPELYTGKSATPQSDFYSLGVSLYRLITDTLPFSVEQITAVMSGSQKNFFPKFPREINPEIPISLDKFVMKLLEKNPQERFIDAQSIVAFINKIQKRNYSFSHRISLVQSVKLNSYIVRANYAHQLEDYVENMKSGNGKVISLIGGDGIGKDDLLTLFKYHFFTNEFYIFDYTCSSTQKDPFFALIKEFSSSTLNNERKTTIFENISARFKTFLEESEEIANTFSDDKTKTQNDFDSAKNFISILSKEKPLIFIIRAGQFLTKDTVDFVNYISALISDAPILIVISVNDPGKLKGLVHSVQIKVSPLSFEETKDYVRNLLNITPPDEFTKNIQQRSSGNPHFIREILIDLLDKKLLLKNKQLNFEINFEDYNLPENLVHAIYNRMSHLDIQTYKYLQKLSIVHTPITKDLIVELFKITQKELFYLIQNAINAEILIEKSVFDDGIKQATDENDDINTKAKKANQNYMSIYEFTFVEAKQRLLRECQKAEKISISEKLISYYDKESNIKDNNLIKNTGFSSVSVYSSMTKFDISICQGIIKNAELCNDQSAVRKYRMILVRLYSSEFDQIRAFNEMCEVLRLDFSDKINIPEFELRTDLMIFIEKADLTGKIKQALALMNELVPREDLFEWHYALSSLYFRNERFDMAEKTLNNAMPLAVTGRQQVRLFIDLAMFYTVLRQYESARYLFEKLKNLKIDSDLEIRYYDRYGMFLTALGNDEEAISWYEDAIIKLQKSVNAKNSGVLYSASGFSYTGSLGSLYNNLGIIYCKFKMYSDAQRLFLQCKKEWEKLNYDRLLGTIYNNIGDMALRQGDTVNALEYFQKAEIISKKIDNKRSLSLAYINYGETNIKLGKFIEAEKNLLEAKKNILEVENASLKTAIDNNLALSKNKIINFNHFYSYLIAEYPQILTWASGSTNEHYDNTLGLNNKSLSLNPLIKSYIFYLFELGDKEKIENILYKDLSYTRTQDEDFYYQLLAMTAILKNDYETAIENFKSALEFAELSTSSYSLSIIYLNLAICYASTNSPLHAEENLSKAEFLIKTYNYYYWSVLKDITQIKINLLKNEIPLRQTLRDALSILPAIKSNHYFLLEIEIYSILMHIYKELNSMHLAQQYFKMYIDKVHEAVRNLPENDQRIFINLKKGNIKNINDANFYDISSRVKIKSNEWNKQVLPLLRLEDTSRIKFFLEKKIVEYFCPSSFAVVVLNANTIKSGVKNTGFIEKISHNKKESLANIDDITENSESEVNPLFALGNYAVYLENNFNAKLLENQVIIDLIKESIEKDSVLTVKYEGRHTLISPILLKTSKIGFLILQDSGEMAFSKNETKMIHQFCFHLSTMFIRISEFDEVNQKVDLMKKLMNITGSMMKTYDLDKLEYELIHEIINITNAKRGFLIKKDKSGNYFFSIALDNENQILSNVTNFSKTTVAEVQVSRHPIYLENFLEELKISDKNEIKDTQSSYLKSSLNEKGEFSSFYTKHSYTTLDNQANSLYCAPIIVDNEVYGLLYLDNLGETKSNLIINNELMDMFLLQVSLAFSNAKTYQSLMAKNWELHTLDSMKNDFISIVSHELNTPLITLQGYIQRLKKNVAPIDIETSDLLLKVDKSTKKLIATIQDIMTLNRYNTSSKIVAEEVNLSEILQSIYFEVDLLSKKRKMRISLEIEDDLPKVEVEWQSFHIMILNIMMNAIRFTADYGSIVLGARRAAFPHEKLNLDTVTGSPQQDDCIVIYVQDNGIGIPDHEQENVFKVFYELGDIYSHRSGFLEFRSGGLGIGLAISKRIAELHHGKIWLKSKEREGTTVFISIPVNQTDKNQANEVFTQTPIN